MAQIKKRETVKVKNNIAYIITNERDMPLNLILLLKVVEEIKSTIVMGSWTII